MDTEAIQMHVSSGLDAVRFNIVRDPSDIDNEDSYFPPDMCHQVFSVSENIFGYKKLRIRMMYAAASMKCYLDIKYDKKITAYPVLDADDVKALIEEWIPEKKYVTTKEEFLAILKKEDPSIVYGETLETFENSIDGEKRTFILNKCSMEQEGFKEFHRRLESWIVWYIDAANLIDNNDHRWTIYVLYEKCKSSKGAIYYPVGYSAVYNFYAYPEHSRPRISQFIVFPPYQNNGLGTFMLKTIYKSIWKLPNVKDITVEDPSEKFQQLRDYLDATYACKELPSYSDKSIFEGFKAAMPEEANKRFKFNPLQARRIYEILKYARVKKTGKGLKEYKAELIHRVETPQRKQEQKLKRLGKAYKKNIIGEADLANVQASEAAAEHIMTSYEPVVARLLKENSEA